MKSSVKTIIGLVVIGLVIVATFLYGNAQRQAQLRHDQDVKAQQQADADKKAKEQASSNQPKAVEITPTPQTTTTPQSTPKTGATEDALIPVTLLGLALYGYIRSRRSLAVAVRA